MAKGSPALLTVEEAAGVLRIGRTKAYAMARQWRATNGAAGLPVVDLGNVLRVPRHALELMVGGSLDTATIAVLPDRRVEPDPPIEPTTPGADPTSRSRSRSRACPAAQLDLFEPPAAS